MQETPLRWMDTRPRLGNRERIDEQTLNLNEAPQSNLSYYPIGTVLYGKLVACT
ncbi:hypothetical protein BGY98DRAFT_961802 [Russula aff. rugulosa BPL654]|nr:hypothetical protein BGY98DRAFT_961802 [Russula aff. rugulosa BPL654]